MNKGLRRERPKTLQLHPLQSRQGNLITNKRKKLSKKRLKKKRLGKKNPTEYILKRILWGVEPILIRNEQSKLTIRVTQGSGGQRQRSDINVLK